MGPQMKNQLISTILDNEDDLIQDFDREKNLIYNLGLIGFQLWRQTYDLRSSNTKPVSEKLLNELEGLKNEKLRTCLG